jgi:lipopolysaccharide export LptBFGC system permease protein LptF
MNGTLQRSTVVGEFVKLDNQLVLTSEDIPINYTLWDMVRVTVSSVPKVFPYCFPIIFKIF